MLELNTPKEILKMLSRKVETKRIELNISQKDLASKAGLSYGTYRNFLDIQKISLLNFISLFHTLGLYSDLDTLTKLETVKTIKELKATESKKRRVREKVK
jgi:transcriptional regulator with XRE-family HTH domain